MEISYSHSKIVDFIESLDGATAARVRQMISRLQTYGHELRSPHSKSLKGGLFELRVLGAKQVRIIYAFHDNEAVLLHIFVKKVWTVSKKEIDYATKILKWYVEG